MPDDNITINRKELLTIVSGHPQAEETVRLKNKYFRIASTPTSTPGANETVLNNKDYLNHIKGRADAYVRLYNEGWTQNVEKIALEVMKNDIPWMLEHIRVLEAEMNAIDNKYREFKDALQRVLST